MDTIFEHVFSPEMMREREKNLFLALLDCAGVCYDINLTQDRILGTPIQIVDGKPYAILEQIGKPKNCTYTEIIAYWAERMQPEDAAGFVAFSDIARITARYEAGERVIRHRFRTYDVLGNSMLAEQKMVLYRDVTNGDLLAIVYVSNGSEIEAIRQKEEQLSEQYAEASRRAELLERARETLPGGYHRCSLESGCPFLFVSHSFEEIVGYTREQLRDELDDLFVNLVYPEDLPRFAELERQVATGGAVDIAYRIRRRDGAIRWIQDSSMRVDWNGSDCLQCTIADITDFVAQQEALVREKDELEELATNVPCGYHRCTTDEGFLLDFVSDSFLETVGYTREEVLGTSFIDMVAPEDRALFMSHEPELTRDGHVELVYRIVRRDGEIRWIKDTTTRVVKGGREFYQCILADITDFVARQEEMVRRNVELAQRESFLRGMEENMPGGYHRCADADGWPFLYFGASFEGVTGWTREEIEKLFENKFINMVLEEDIPLCAGIIEEIEKTGYSNAIYRLKKRGGGYIWVSDSTMRVTIDGETFYHGMLADVSTQIEALERAKREAEESNHAKTAFLFNASHDIRTPMNAILGFARIIDENTHDAAVVGETIRKIIQASQTLMTLLNDVLALSRIERGKEHVEAQPLDMTVHANKLYELFGADMQKAGLTFTMENDITHALVLADDLKLTRIAMNLLSNARKFTPAGGSVTFGITEAAGDERGATYTLFVRDTGIGMSEEFQKRAFEQFERERSSTESGVSGSGLGLAIIKQYCDLLGGTCHIKSEIGVGTEIIVTIPLLFADEHKPEVHDEDHTTRFRDKRLLLVEDNAFNREIARYVLESAGFVIEEAENGVMCLEMLTEHPAGYYALILMDIQMPLMNGYKATEEIRRHPDPRIAATPILAMTANAFEEDKRRCLDVGMDGHIGKPLDADAVLSEIRRILDR